MPPLPRQRRSEEGGGPRPPDRLGGAVFGAWMWACVTCWAAALFVPGGGQATRAAAAVAVVSWVIASAATVWLVVEGRRRG